MTVRLADVSVGTELPEQVFRVTRADLVRYAGASGDFNPIHWNDRVATAVGLPGVIAHGMFTMGLAGRAVTQWAGNPAALGHPDVIAPPTFPFVMTFQASRRMIDDPELGIDYSRVVHGEQKFAHTRPVRAGDALTVTVTLETVRSAGGHDMITSRSDVATVEGEHVATAWSTLVVRGDG